MHRVQLLLFALAALPLAACGRPAPSDPADKNPEVRRASARLGPVRYSFDASRLTLAEVMLALPPRYQEMMWAVKLIPAKRAAMLGSQACDYRSTGVAEMCNSQDEAGLALALLERPLADYRRAFEEADVGDIELFDTSVDGVAGFAFTAEPEDGGRQYRFVPVRDRTFVIARRPGPIAEQDSETIDQVIAGIDLGQ